MRITVYIKTKKAFSFQPLVKQRKFVLYNQVSLAVQRRQLTTCDIHIWWTVLYLSPESIEWFIEGQAFLRSHDLAPPPVCNLSLFHSLPVCSRSSLLTRERGEGRGTKSCDREKAWSSINRSILSAFHYVTHLGFSWNWFILDWTNIHHHLLCNIKLRKITPFCVFSQTECMNMFKWLPCK